MKQTDVKFNKFWLFPIISTLAVLVLVVILLIQSGSKLVTVNGGTFMMRTMERKDSVYVTLKSFRISAYEITVKEFRTFIEASGYKTIAELEGWAFQTDENGLTTNSGVSWRNYRENQTGGDEEAKYPVVNVSWYDAVEYCNWRSADEGLTPAYSIDKASKDYNNYYSDNTFSDNQQWTVRQDLNANGYRLPTEAEWEFAARGGAKTKGFIYSGSSDLGTVGWYFENSGYSVHLIGTKLPNELGIFDMSGNVDEWCWDWFGQYSSGSATDPTGAQSGSYKVVRGGSWNYHNANCRPSFRQFMPANTRDAGLGFRVVRAK